MGSFTKFAAITDFRRMCPDLTKNKFIFLRPKTILVIPEEVFRTACLNVQYTKYNSNALEPLHGIRGAPRKNI